MSSTQLSHAGQEAKLVEKQLIEKLEQKQKEIERTFEQGLSEPLHELKGFTGLTFWSLPSCGGSPEKTKAFVKKLEKLLVKQGEVNIIDQENGIDFDGLKTGAVVYLNNFPVLIQNLKAKKEELAKNTEFVSLKLMTPVVIKQNSQNLQAEIYEKSIYVDTSSDFQGVEQIALSLVSDLLEQLILANPNLKGNAKFFIYN
ncbi:MAG: hypothetical protein H7A38_03960 [Chlamydiales bacterium]|nr:hypothetical protein [Chlamydiales bacterium]